MIGRRKVKVDITGILDYRILMEFSSVVSGNCFKAIAMAVDQANDLLVECGGRFVGQFTNQEKASFSFNKGHYASITALSEDGFYFPMALESTGFNACGPFSDMTFIG